MSGSPVRRTMYCHDCRKWTSAEYDGPEGDGTGTWTCQHCGSAVMCDECGLAIRDIPPACPSGVHGRPTHRLGAAR